MVHKVLYEYPVILYSYTHDDILKSGIIVVYDTTDLESFNNVKQWLFEIDKYATSTVNKLLVGNKSDLTVQRAVTYDQGKEFAESFGMEFIETSAKVSSNVEKAFLMMATQIKSKLKTQTNSKSSPNPAVNLEGKKIKSSSCC